MRHVNQMSSSFLTLFSPFRHSCRVMVHVYSGAGSVAASINTTVHEYCLHHTDASNRNGGGGVHTCTWRELYLGALTLVYVCLGERGFPLHSWPSAVQSLTPWTPELLLNAELWVDWESGSHLNMEPGRDGYFPVINSDLEDTHTTFITMHWIQRAIPLP